MRLILIEGIDRVGKTTLCQKLNDSIKGSVIFKGGNLTCNIPFMGRDRDRLTESIYGTVQTLAMFADTDKVILIDRLHLSELVYGKFDRFYYNEHMLYIDCLLSRMNAKLILVEPTDINRSSLEHGKDLTLHAKEFDLLFKKTGIKDKVKCNYDMFDFVVEDTVREMEGIG